MKKTMCAFFLVMICSAFLLSASAQSQVSDRIDLGRLGGTTRIAAAAFQLFDIQVSDPVVEISSSQNDVLILIQNYRGNALVEIVGPEEVKESHIDVYDMRFDEINLSGFRKGDYTIRVTLGSKVYTRAIKVGTYEQR